MPIRFLDLTKPTDEVRTQVAARWQRVLDTSHFVLGEQNAEFEARFAQFVGVPHCVAVNSGTDALLLALAALETKPGDIVVAPANTFIATCAPALHLGADVRLVNPGADYTLCVDEVEALARRLGQQGRKVHAVMVVHLYGQPANLQRLQQLASTYDFHLIEDCAQAHGATRDNETVGSVGDVACFSFYPGKNLGAFGDGGAVVTKNSNLAQRLRLLRNHGSQRKYDHEILGYCSRLDELQAAVLNEKLPFLPAWNRRRQEIATTYRERLAQVAGLIVPQENPAGRSVYHLFVVRVLEGRRDDLIAFLEKREIQTLIHYPTPIHEHAAFRGRLGELPDLRFSERLAREILSLPLHPALDVPSVHSVCDAIVEFLRPA